MRYRHITLIVLPLLVVGVVALRWPRLDQDVTVTRSEVSPNQMTVEYRMPKPFTVMPVQYLYGESPQYPENGVAIKSVDPVRSKRIAVIESEHDLVRGEYYVRMTYAKSSTFLLSSQGHEYEIRPWTEQDLQHIAWIPHSVPESFGNDTAVPIVMLSESEDGREVIIVYAGTDIDRYIERFSSESIE